MKFSFCLQEYKTAVAKFARSNKLSVLGFVCIRTSQKENAECIYFGGAQLRQNHALNLINEDWSNLARLKHHPANVSTGQQSKIKTFNR